MGLIPKTTAGILPTALAISEIVVGARYLEDCPIQRYIPIYLVVSGIVFLLTQLPTIALSESKDEIKTGSICAGIIALFHGCWFIAGNVWIYSIYQPNYDPDKGPYCDKTLYLFAFWITTMSYILYIGLFLMLCCCFCAKMGMSPEEGQQTGSLAN